MVALARDVAAESATVDLRLGDAAELLAVARGARLLVFDPAWDQYRQKPGKAAPAGRYHVLPLDVVADHLEASAACALSGARLVVWHCWPLLMEAIGLLCSKPARLTAAKREKREQWARILAPKGWRPVTGGGWHKSGCKLGVGYHWRGHSEPVLVYVRPGATPYRNSAEHTRSGWSSDPTGHSAKPVEWQRSWLRRWTRPGELVVEPYAGRGSLAVACLAEGRAYAGREIDPEQHAKALRALADWRAA